MLKRWEYKAVSLDKDNYRELESELAKLASDGWLSAGFSGKITHGTSKAYEYPVFMRKIPLYRAISDYVSSRLNGLRTYYKMKTEAKRKQKLLTKYGKL